MLRITDSLNLDERDFDERFVRASGPGGQNVNKVATAVQLRFDIRHSPNLPEDVRERLVRLAGSRLTRDGIIVIAAQRHRTLERNRKDALDRLVQLIRRAAVAPAIRRASKPPAASRERRLQSKRRRALVKDLRQSRPEP